MKVNRFLYAENRNIPVQEEDAWGSAIVLLFGFNWEDS